MPTDHTFSPPACQREQPSSNLRCASHFRRAEVPLTLTGCQSRLKERASSFPSNTSFSNLEFAVCFLTLLTCRALCTPCVAQARTSPCLKVFQRCPNLQSGQKMASPPSRQGFSSPIGCQASNSGLLRLLRGVCGSGDGQ